MQIQTKIVVIWDVKGWGVIWDPGGSRIGLGAEEVLGGVHDMNPPPPKKNGLKKNKIKQLSEN